MESLGIFIQGTTAVGVLVLAVLTFMGRSTNALRDDIKELRVEMNANFSEIRIEMHDMNIHLGRVDTRLGRVEGHLRISDDHHKGER